MRDMLPLLETIPFPALRRGKLDTLQINVGYRCNQSCFHCHVNAGPQPHRGNVGRRRRYGARLHRAPAHRDARHHRRRARTQRAFPPPGARRPRARRQGDGPLQSHHPGAAGPGRPRRIPRRAAGRGRRLDALLSAGQCRAPARQGRVRRLDPRLEAAQRARLRARSARSTLNLVYNPQGPALPPPQVSLEADYKRVLGEQYGIVFNKLFVLANMPIQRFGSMLVSKGEFDGYLQLLQDAHLDANLDGVMCRNLISVDWRGFVYDCDFNQMLDLPLTHGAARARASVGTARRRPRRQSGPRRRPLLRLHRRPRLELRRRAERGGGMNAGCHRRAQLTSRRPHLPARLQLFASGVRPRAGFFRRRALCGRRALRQSRSARRRRAAGRGRSCAGRRSSSTATSIGSTPSRIGSPRSSAALRAHRALARQCGNRDRPRRSTSAPAAAAPIPTASAKTSCGAPTRFWQRCAAASPAPARAQLAQAADASGRAGRRLARRHRAWRRRLAGRLGLCAGCARRRRQPAVARRDRGANRASTYSPRPTPVSPRCAIFFCRPAGSPSSTTALPACRIFPAPSSASSRASPPRPRRTGRSTACSATASISTRSRSTTISQAFLDRFLARWPPGSPAHASYYRRIVAGPDYALTQAAAPMTLSIIMPVLDEAAGIEAALVALAPLRAAGAEVDRGRRRQPRRHRRSLPRPLADRVIAAPRGRASQMNAGAAIAAGDVLLFLHADTRLPDGRRPPGA